VGFRENISGFYPINQEVIGVGKLIKNKRFEIFLKTIPKEFENCYLKKVFEAIIEYSSDHDDEIWNSNFRCMLYNNINLALYITFKYYFLGQPIGFSIINQIRTYEEINFFLNGRLFICEENTKPSSNLGFACFNFFGYNINTDDSGKPKPFYLIYTYLLQLIEEEPGILYSRIKDILALFSIASQEVENCTDRLVSSGMIEQKYPHGPAYMKYKITSKGKYYKIKFFNDIHYLYFSSLDTLLPMELFLSLQISPLCPERNEKRNYPPYCIITAILFLQFLLQQNRKILNDELETKLKEKGVSISIFELPIKKEILSKSIEAMVHKCKRDPSYLSILEKWLKEHCNER